MPSLGARLVVYGFFGAFGVMGLLFLILAARSTVESVEFLHAARRTQGTVIELRPVQATRAGAGTVVPVFRFRSDDGLEYLGFSNASVRPTAFRAGDHVPVLYLPGQPATARIDMFPALWTGSLVFGIVGAAFTCVAGLATAAVLRMRHRLAADAESRSSRLRDGEGNSGAH